MCNRKPPRLLSSYPIYQDFLAFSPFKQDAQGILVTTAAPSFLFPSLPFPFISFQSYPSPFSIIGNHSATALAGRQSSDADPGYTLRVPFPLHSTTKTSPLLLLDRRHRFGLTDLYRCLGGNGNLWGCFRWACIAGGRRGMFWSARRRRRRGRRRKRRRQGQS